MAESPNTQGFSKLWSVDEVDKKLKLPDELADLPNTQELPILYEDEEKKVVQSKEHKQEEVKIPPREPWVRVKPYGRGYFGKRERAPLPPWYTCFEMTARDTCSNECEVKEILTKMIIHYNKCKDKRINFRANAAELEFISKYENTKLFMSSCIDLLP
jgi:hypothetical protein